MLDLDTVAAGHLAELRAAAERAAADYSLISWIGKPVRSWELPTVRAQP